MSDVGKRVLDITGTLRGVVRLDLTTEKPADLHHQLVQRHALAARDVERLADTLAALGREQVRLDDVVNKGEVTRMLPISENRRCSTSCKCRDELRDDGGVLGGRI